MARQQRQNDSFDLGQLLQLYNTFSPEAEARSQLLQQQAQITPQLNQAQLAEINARIAAQQAGTEQTQVSTSQIIPRSQAELAAQQAALERSKFDLTSGQELLPLRKQGLEAEIRASQVGADKVAQDTTQAGQLFPLKLDEFGLQKKLLGSEIAKNTLGISGLLPPSDIAAGLHNYAIEQLGAQPQIDKAKQIQQEKLKAKINDSIKTLGEKKTKAAFGTTPEAAAIVNSQLKASLRPGDPGFDWKQFLAEPGKVPVVPKAEPTLMEELLSLFPLWAPNTRMSIQPPTF